MNDRTMNDRTMNDRTKSYWRQALTYHYNLPKTYTEIIIDNYEPTTLSKDYPAANRFVKALREADQDGE